MAVFFSKILRACTEIYIWGLPKSLNCTPICHQHCKHHWICWIIWPKWQNRFIFYPTIYKYVLPVSLNKVVMSSCSLVPIRMHNGLVYYLVEGKGDQDPYKLNYHIGPESWYLPEVGQESCVVDLACLLSVNFGQRWRYRAAHQVLVNVLICSSDVITFDTLGIIGIIMWTGQF